MQNLLIQDNPLQTRQYLVKALETIVHPLIPYYSDKNTQLTLINTGTWALSRTANMDALARCNGHNYRFPRIALALPYS